MKILYRSPFIFKCCQLIVLNIFALYFEKSILTEVDFLEVKVLESFIMNYKTLIFLGVVNIVALWRSSRVSLLFIGLIYILYAFYSIETLYLQFNKLTLVFFSIFSILYFYFFQVLKDELSQGFMRPFFLKNYVGGKPEFEIRTVIQGQNERIEGTLANWDESGCFVYLDEACREIDKEVWVDFPFEGVSFQDKAIVARVASDRKSLGLFIPHRDNLSDEKKFKWKSFIKILNDRGLIPHRLK